MKKLNFLALFFLLFSFCFSQNFNDKLKNTRMGLYVSPTLNFVQTDSEQTETNTKPGVIYGYAIEMALNENHRLESGLAISYKGGGIETGTYSDYKIQYITLPIFIKMRSREIGYFNYFARIGPSLNFKVREMISSNEEKNTKLALIDISIFLGAEYSLGGKTSVEGSLFFNNSITNALEAENDPQALFHQLGIRLGFLF
ncbi:MAG: hypothetical protein CMP56_03105 [Flavobacteriales bacterium]|nr:hypothetical protein [Flavobacteriales bacterium]